MLSAQKEEQRLADISKPSMGSIDKFVNSIGSLQQRLDALSLDEIIEVETKAETLKARLTDLQKTIEVLSNLKQSVAAAAQSIEQAPVPSLSIEFESLSRPLHLQQLLAPSSKLIPFPRPVKVARDKPRNLAIDAHKEIAVVPEKASVRPSNDRTRVDSQAPSKELAGNDSAGPSPERSEARGSRLNERPSELDDAKQLDSVSAEQISPSPEIPDEDSPNTAAVATGESQQQDSVAPEFPRRDELPTGQFEFTRERTVKTTPTHTEAFVDTAPLQATPTTAQHQADFDQRLLDDLIKNYGEFAVSPNLPAVVEPEVVVDNEPKHQAAAAGARMGAHAHGTRISNLPLNKKEAEIDRQLKQIIKDYGEYDLYSQQTPMNFKRGVIAAFALLGVLFFGFYFFSGPTAARHASPTQQQEPLTAQAGDDRSPASGAPTESDSSTENTSTKRKN